MNKKIEILAPAGSYESLKAAIAAGADAVYIGGTRFGARAFADNLSEEKLLEVIDYVHLHGRKIYLTINTLLKEYELRDEFYQYLLPYYKQGIDAVIVQDLGVLQYVKEHFPDLPIHASTQMTITDLLGAKFMETQGVERIVTSREMNIQEIKEIAENTNLEIESFVHGALCYCYSGQCLYSSLIGGRSGNRGQCAQPCRLPYEVVGKKDGNSKKTQYIMSLKDICTLEYIPELVETGIHSFKIEGRMKKPEYVALVTQMYRKYVDLYLKSPKEFKVDPKDKEQLLDLYNRGGSHGGYYHKHNGRDMVSLDRPNHAGVPALKIVKYNGKELIGKALVDIMPGDVIEFPAGKKEAKPENYTFANPVKKGQTVSIFIRSKLEIAKDMVLNRTRNESLLREINEKIINVKIKEKINGKLILSEGVSAKLVLYYGDIQIETIGSEVQSAKNQPMRIETVEKQMRKTGNTEFEFDKLDIGISGNIFMPMQSLNELRRESLEKLAQEIVLKYRRQNEKTPEAIKKSNSCIYEQKRIEDLYVYAETIDQLRAALNFKSVKRIYLDANAIENIWNNYMTKHLIDFVHAYPFEKEIYLALPHVFRSSTKKLYQMHYDIIKELDWDGVLIRNMESYQFLMEQGYQGKIITDYNMYFFNKYAKKFWGSKKIDSFTAPFELNYRELKELGIENGELIVYGYQPMMVSAQCIMNTTKGCQKKADILEFKDRFHKSFHVKNLCDYCYNVIYNTSPLVLIDQKNEIEELNPKAIRLHFTIESENEVKEILKSYNQVFVDNVSCGEPEFDFTRGHFKRGIK